MGITIKDIAGKVGVSPSTVSRVLNNKGNISAKKRQEIFDITRKMNYHPNNLARNFAKRRTGMIGLVINAADSVSFSNAFFSRSVFAIEKVLQAEGYGLMITNDVEVPRTSSPIIKMVYEKHIDGLILPSSAVQKRLIEQLKAEAFPFVVLGKPGVLYKDCSWVDVDNTYGASSAVAHLVHRGYKRIAFVANNLKTIFVQDRLEGFKSGLRDHGIFVPDTYVLNCADQSSSCTGLVSRLLRSHFRPNAFLCCDNILAFNTMQAVKSLGLSVPHDVGIVTFDNYPIAEYTDPALTSVDVDTFHLGTQAAEMLLTKIRSENTVNQYTLLSTTMIPRASSVRKGIRGDT
jgi:DNA-binding LacI/PurR family transcriptional regulator